MTEAEKRTHRVCFTGHRPEKLTRFEWLIRKDLERQIVQAIADGFDVFISGMARGADIWAAEIVLQLRKAGYAIKLMCACPYDGFERSWGEEWRKRYAEVLESADYVKFVCPCYSPSCFQIRNEWMVNHASLVIAVFANTPSGTMNTIEYAIRKRVPVYFIKG